MTTETDIAALDAKLSAIQATLDAAKKDLAALKLSTAPVVPKFYVGGATGGNADPASLEAKAGAKYGIRRTYHGHDVAAVVKTIKANIAAGRAISEVSMKVSDWAAAAKGTEDAWAKDAANQIAAAITGTKHIVRVIINHEPENDDALKANVAEGRDNWKNMQARLAPFFNKPGIEFGVCLMGWHQVGGRKALWNLDACVPKIKDVKFVSFDIYESYGTPKDGGGTSTTWKSYETTYIKPFSDWAKANGKYLAMSEIGVTEAALKAKPTWFSDLFALLKKYGWTSFSYFNTDLNSVAHWQMDADSPREKAFLALVKANKI